MIIAPQFGPSQGSAVILERPPHIELTQKAMAFVKNILYEFEQALGESVYIILAKVEVWEMSLEKTQWRPSKSLGYNISIGGNPLSTISEMQRKRLNIVDGIPFVVVEDTFVNEDFLSGTIIDFDEMANRLFQFKKGE